MAVAPEVQFIELLVPMVGVSFCTVIFAMCVQSLLIHISRRSQVRATRSNHADVPAENPASD